ncbi:hypothetical protein H0E87_007455 [Populus deltoides]|uniref:Uncharacterized protein n=1 Tax=Populus deltoides TaxID=3696 RepID=A0A8T2ZBF6_POPDE|nr:hypothetical protein H0E87_007455 [Populus deltoides]
MPYSTRSNSDFDEYQWVINIGRALEKELEEDGDESPVCIFTVPKTLMSSDPDSYTPQQLSLGPYHYRRAGLHEMERYKLSAAKKLQNQLHSNRFENLVEQLIKLEPRIRACYHKYLDFNAETLAWMMALDVSFLLEFLQIYSVRETKMLSRAPSGMSHLLDYSKRKSAHHVILRDMVMLENQVPQFILRKVLEFQYMSAELADEMLLSMVIGLAKELSPFKMIELPKTTEVLEHSHLLDFLYDIIVPKVEGPIEIVLEEVADQIESDNQQEEERSGVDSSYVKQLLTVTWNMVSQLKIAPVRLLKNISSSMAIKLKLSRTILSKLKNPDDRENEDSSRSTKNKPPLVEEITIPSVTQLSKYGVSFIPTKGNISTIAFDKEKAAFHLPTISLDLNSEVMFRNLVAYEISSASGPLLFTRYIELMNGIIDTEEDARLLRESGIILNRLKSDEEVANMFNGMSNCKCIRLTKAPFLDKVIEDVNKYYDSLWMVAAGDWEAAGGCASVVSGRRSWRRKECWLIVGFGAAVWGAAAGGQICGRCWREKADRSASVGDAAADGEDRLRGERRWRGKREAGSSGRKWRWEIVGEELLREEALQQKGVGFGGLRERRTRG